MAQTWLSKYSTYEEEVTGTVTGIIAFAGGGQASATALTSKFNSVDTCATNEDSVKLVSALIGKKQYVYNNTSKILSVYPQTGEYINGVVDNEYFILPGQLMIFESNASGKWTVTSNERNYKIYSALIFPNGTGDPYGYVLENTIGNIVWTRNSIGIYYGTLTGAFTENKTLVLFSSFEGAGVTHSGYWGDENIIVIETYDSSNNLYDNVGSTPRNIEIRVYPSNWQFT